MELDVDFDRKAAAFLLLGVFVGAGLSLGYTQFSTDESRASQNLVSFLENQSGQDLEVVTTEKAGEFYQIDVRTPQDQLVTYYTSSDGNMYTTNMVDIEELRTMSQALVDFRQCLAGSGTVMFGNASQTGTQQQIQVLGGAQVVAPIYRDVSNTTNLRTAAQLGIRQVPAFYRNQSAVQGVQTLQQVERFTGCDYTAN